MSRSKSARRPVSRVLSTTPKRSWMAIHLGRPLPDASRDLPGRRLGNRLALPSEDSGLSPLLGLAPGGVYRAAPVTGGAVRSYRTLSPLPAGTPKRTGRRFAFCGTFPGVAPAGRYPAPLFPWSPDFPPPLDQPKPAAGAAIRPSGTPRPRRARRRRQPMPARGGISV